MTWFWPSSAAASNSFMPPEGTAIAGQVDSLYGAWLFASAVSFFLVVGGMVWFVVKYRRQSLEQKSAYITHNHQLEFLWSFIPLCIFMGLFGWGWIIFHQMRSFPKDALEVHVVGKKWAWRFIYKNGKESAGLDGPPTMVVPVGRPVKLILSSEKINPGGDDPRDKAVLHSFYIPAFRIKQDVVPGRYTAEWFQADKVGTYHVFCAEFCGDGHSAMHALIKAVPNDEFEKWLKTDEPQVGGLAGAGKKLFVEKACSGCHSLDGTRIVGPTFKGLYGRNEEMEGGPKLAADENYLRESILQSNAKIVKGYPAGVMPVFAGQLTDDDVAALIEFIKTVQ
jgi:cytochrome c oxidase subunit 2